MHEYKDVITLNRNSRGCYILDTVKGCSCMANKPGGCYGDCYASHIAARYGFDFSKPVKRGFLCSDSQLYFSGFSDTTHEAQIVKQIKAAEMPFVRIGEMGDPSENWEHTLSVCQAIAIANKPIVIITKHWKRLTDDQISAFSELPVVFNTSVSALDSTAELEYRLQQHERLPRSSVLRVVSCAFNDKEHEKTQQELLSRDKVIDTVFRPNANNPFLLSGTISAKKVKFLGSSMLASMHKDDVFFGYCRDCPDQCGAL